MKHRLMAIMIATLPLGTAGFAATTECQMTLRCQEQADCQPTRHSFEVKGVPGTQSYVAHTPEGPIALQPVGAKKGTWMGRLPDGELLRVFMVLTTKPGQSAWRYAITQGETKLRMWSGNCVGLS